MKDYQTLIDSGLLDLYVLNQTSEQENLYIEGYAALYPEVLKEINDIEIALEKYALLNQVTPDPIVKPFLLATIDFSDRLKFGEVPTEVPLLDKYSSPEDYLPWLSREDMAPPEDFEDVFAKILAYTPEVISAIVWIRNLAPQETHDHSYERFLIIEGCCNIYIEKEMHSLVAGDFLQIPLHQSHYVEVTSKIPCKVLLQRVAA